MLTAGRLAGTFIAMMAAGYLVIMAFLPAPTGVSVRDDDDPGQSAAMRLSAEAQALVAHKPAGNLQ